MKNKKFFLVMVCVNICPQITTTGSYLIRTITDIRAAKAKHLGIVLSKKKKKKVLVKI